MKAPPLRLIAVALLVNAAGAQVSDSNISYYGVGKTRGYIQSDATRVTADSYTLEVFVAAAPGGVINGATLQGAISDYFGVQGVLSVPSTDFGAEFYSKVHLDQFGGVFPDDNNGNHILRIDTGVPGGQIAGGYDHSISVKLGAANYVSQFPTISLDNGEWSDGQFMFNVSSTTFMQWNFADYNQQTDLVRVIIRSADGGQVLVNQLFQGNNPGGFSLNPGLFTFGQSYIGQVSFIKMTDMPSDVVGATGFAFYGLQTEFNLHAVPEPSTYALLALGLGVVLVPVLRRRLRR